MTREYLVVYGKGKRNWGGYAPDVQGCISTGDSLEHMREMLREALEFHFEGMAEDGDPPPPAVATEVDFGPDDWDGVEYYVIEKLKVKLPSRAKLASRKFDAKRMAVSA